MASYRRATYALAKSFTAAADAASPCSLSKAANRFNAAFIIFGGRSTAASRVCI